MLYPGKSSCVIHIISIQPVNTKGSQGLPKVVARKIIYDRC